MNIQNVTKKTPSFVLRACGILSATLLLAIAPASQAGVVYRLNDTVLAGGTGANTFMVQNSQVGSGLSYVGGGSPSLTYTEGAATQFTYFLGYFSAKTLTNLNDSITLSYTLTAPAGAFRTQTDSAAFRFGLLNSGGSQISANIATSGTATFNNYTGYGAFYDPNAATGPSNDGFKQRTASNSTLMSVSGFTAISGAPNTVWTGSTTSITGSYTLTRVATGLQITSVINGGTPQTVTDTSGINYTFDTFSFGTVSGTANNPALVFSDLTISVVPEPSAVALAALGLGAILFRVKYRRTV